MAIAVIMVMIAITMMVMMPRMAIMFAISTAFRIEGDLHMLQLRAKPLKHGFNHMILADQNAAAINLRRQMPIAQMPRQTREAFWRFRRNFYQWLWCGLHQDDTTTFQQQPITLAEHGRFLKVQ
jgi:hypothetical protein